MQYTQNGLLYPEEGDLVRDGGNVMMELAKALDPPIAMITVTPETGWTFNSGRAVQAGIIVSWVIDMTRTDPPITTDATGNIVTDVPVFNSLPVEYRPFHADASATTAQVRCVKSANHEISGYVNQAGACVLTHGWPSQTFSSTSGYRFYGFYLLGL